MSNNKNQIMVDYLLTCDAISSGLLFFNYAEEKESTNNFLTIADEIDLHKPYIDGSVMRQYTFQLICYRPLSNVPIVTGTSYVDENVENINEIQNILDWISEQEELRNYPNFGSSYIPEKIYCLTDDPNLYSIDTESDPPLAKYSVIIRFEYLDKSKTIFN